VTSLGGDDEGTVESFAHHIVWVVRDFCVVKLQPDGGAQRHMVGCTTKSIVRK
jgi:hypothetical protein